MQNSAFNVKRLLAIIFAFFALFIVIVPLLSLLGAATHKYVSLDDNITVTTSYNGEVKTYDSNIFDSPKAGTVLDCRIKLPRTKWIPYSVLCFYNYNSVVNVYYNGQNLYSHGSEEKADKRYTGHTMIRVSIPEEAWGNSILVRFEQLENNTVASFRDVVAMEAGESWLYPLVVSSRFGIISMASFFIASLVLLIVFTVMLISGTNVLQGVLMCLFCADFSIWNMGYNHALFLFSDDTRVVPYLEYIALYLVVPLFSGYLLCECKDKVDKRVIGTVLVANTALFATVASLEHLIPWKGYVSFVNVQNIFMVVSLFVLLWYAIRHRHDTSVSNSIFRIGISVSIALSLLEVVRRALSSYAGSGFPEWIINLSAHSLSSLIIFSLELTIFASYIVRIMREYRLQLEKNQLEQLAYTDMLTGIPNRAFVDDKLSKLEAKDNYVIIFLDVNHLKYANDNFGHEKGDILLKSVADAIKLSCTGRKGYFGRYGGDEFVICLLRKSDIRIVLKRFNDTIDDYNREKILPFKVEAATGISTHTAGDPRTADEVIHEADTNMYKEKQEQEKDDPEEMGR